MSITSSSIELTQSDEEQISATVSQMYWEEGHLPTAEAVFEKLHRIYPLDRIEELFADSDFQSKLERIGIKASRIEGVLTPKQILVANKVMNPYDSEPLRTFLDALEIKTAQYNAWLRDPTFQAYLRARAEAAFSDLTPAAHTALQKAIVRGDMSAVKMFYEMTGKYTKNVNLNLNVESVMLRVVEIIVARVEDPKVVELIAADIQELMSGA